MVTDGAWYFPTPMSHAHSYLTEENLRGKIPVESNFARQSAKWFSWKDNIVLCQRMIFGISKTKKQLKNQSSRFAGRINDT